MEWYSLLSRAKIHYILFYLDCGIYVGYYDFWDLMWDKCGIVCQIIVCRKISTKMWDKCGIWEKVEHKQIVRDSLCGMNVGLVCVLPCWRCWVNDHNFSRKWFTLSEVVKRMLAWIGNGLPLCHYSDFNLKLDCKQSFIAELFLRHPYIVILITAKIFHRVFFLRKSVH